MQIKQMKSLLRLSRRHISALYVTGDKANENYAVLTPFMEFSKTLIDGQDELQTNIAQRRLNVNLDKIIQKYAIFRQGELKKSELEAEREELSKEIKNLKDPSVLNEKKAAGKELRNALKTLREQLYPIEDDFIHEFLKLPNKLNRKTPATDMAIIYRQGLPDTNIASVSHLDYKNLIDYRDPTCYYLKSEASNFDFRTPINVVSRFVENGFVQFVNPDFVRTLLLEAALTDLNRIDVVREEDENESKVNLLHLTGGGSAASFLGFITKLTIFPSQLPLRFITSGREYLLPTETDRGLYSVMQSSTVQTFVATQTEQELEQEIENVLGLLVDIFREYDVHFRVVYTPAHQLTGAESLRATIQLYSLHYAEYIDIGHISDYSNFISKRLLFNYRDGKNYKFPFFAAGPIINITKLLACLLENSKQLKIVDNSKKDHQNAVENFKNLFS